MPHKNDYSLKLSKVKMKTLLKMASIGGDNPSNAKNK